MILLFKQQLVCHARTDLKSVQVVRPDPPQSHRALLSLSHSPRLPMNRISVPAVWDSQMPSNSTHGSQAAGMMPFKLFRTQRGHLHVAAGADKGVVPALLAGSPLTHASMQAAVAEADGVESGDPAPIESLQEVPLPSPPVIKGGRAACNLGTLKDCCCLKGCWCLDISSPLKPWKF